MLKGLPNTYAYSKALTEDLVNSYAGRLPIVITRPSIGMCVTLSVFNVPTQNPCKFIATIFSSIILFRLVTAAWKEPYPGWVEGMNGPTGLIVGAARGKQLKNR